ncbi:MAG TPA: hypothetical protein VN376_01310 [Longilinea sp.]|nr:hypothetical protein [Longilinea sp.]
MLNADLIWTIVSFLLTLMILSYIIGDNPLFRIASYIFVGAAAGYVAVIVIYQVIIPRLIFPLMSGDVTQMAITVVPLVLALLLFTKFIPRYSRLGNVSMAFLVGAGAAVMIGGAVIGTLFTQVAASINLFDPAAAAANPGGIGMQLLQGLVIVGGTVSTLAYFHFGVKPRNNQPPQRGSLVQILAVVGEFFIAVTLGALFSGVFAAALTALIERLGFLWTTIASFL